MTMFKDKVAVVLGATSVGGMGEAVAKDLAALGAKVVVAGRRLDAATTLARQIQGYAHACDICDEASIAALVEYAANAVGAGTIDIFINAAGLPVASMFADIDAAMLMHSAQANLIGPVLAMKHAARFFSHGGVFLQFTSISAQQPTPATAPYAMFKAGLEHALRIAAMEYGAAGIRFLGVAPGIVFTPMTEFINNDFVRKTVESVTPLGRMVEISDIVPAIRFLVSGDCYETGQILPITGGALLTRALLPQELFPAA